MNSLKYPLHHSLFVYIHTSTIQCKSLRDSKYVWMLCIWMSVSGKGGGVFRLRRITVEKQPVRFSYITAPKRIYSFKCQSISCFDFIFLTITYFVYIELKTVFCVFLASVMLTVKPTEPKVCQYELSNWAADPRGIERHCH